MPPRSTRRGCRLGWYSAMRADAVHAARLGVETAHRDLAADGAGASHGPRSNVGFQGSTVVRPDGWVLYHATDERPEERKEAHRWRTRRSRAVASRRVGPLATSCGGPPSAPMAWSAVAGPRPWHTALAWIGRATPGVKVRIGPPLSVDLYLAVARGVPVAEVARNVDSAVRHGLRLALGREIDELAIHVDRRGRRFSRGPRRRTR